MFLHVVALLYVYEHVADINEAASNIFVLKFHEV